MEIGDGKGWFLRGVIRNNLTGEIDGAMNIPAPTKEDLVPDEYLRKVESIDWQESHVLPADDVIEHELSKECECFPTVNFVSDDIPFIMHEAQDGREAIEWLDTLFNSE